MNFITEYRRASPIGGAFLYVAKCGPSRTPVPTMFRMIKGLFVQLLNAYKSKKIQIIAERKK